MTAPGLFAAPLTSAAPVESGRFAPPVVVEVPPVVPLRTRGAAVARRHGLPAARVIVASVAVLTVAAALATTAIVYGALTLGSARMTTEGTMVPPLPASLPINALPAGTVISATLGEPVKVGIARLVRPAIADIAQLVVIGPISAGIGQAGYSARCVSGSCAVGDTVTVRLEEIAGADDTGISVWQWFTGWDDNG